MIGERKSLTGLTLNADVVQLVECLVANEEVCRIVPDHLHHFDRMEYGPSILTDKMNPPRGKPRGITERGFAPMTAGGIHPRSKLRGIEPSGLKRNTFSNYSW